MAAAGVVRPPAAEPHGAVRHVLPALALLAEAVILELEHGGEGEGVVGAGHVHLLRPEARIGPEDVLAVMAGDGGDRPVLIVHVDARLADPARDGADQARRMAAVLQLGRAAWRDRGLQS